MKANEPLTLLFDLDGTLILMDQKGLELRFMLRAIPRFSSIIRPWRFRKAFWEAAEVIQQNQSATKNFELYVEVLSKHAFASPEKVMRVAREAIEQDFAALHKHFSPFPGARETLLKAKQQGHRLMVATNPVFPLSGVLTRMKYGGVSDIPFDYITNAEVMTRTKPQVGYYQELVEKLELDPTKCVMVGNDPVKDLPAKEVGMTTFILDVPGVSPLEDEFKNDSRLDHYGTYQDFQNIFL